ncbi:YeeE/YedE family protein [Pseudodonghicola flavimaris]|uniref:YeeE/YedE family protein n=1 Tax=Pseudodonghicola flavimaris TaxID=3050036 RepID=A0ABT7EUZ0_9RHOB|nr:YeeE/YedE family protein [Pseudodonghicola flavimaris]MDK3016161.1 YeeE/YedE family protein [Pseudodonghicola flavimaris]
MFETFGFETTTAREASVLFGLGLGLAFGILARLTQFCFRRALVGTDRRAALGVWMTALAVALAGTQIAVGLGWIGFADHRLLSPDLPVLAITLGGLAFGAGMVLTRGCVSRLTVLAGGGNLRALLVLLVFALTAHATLKGVLAPLRSGLGTVTLPLGDSVSLAALPGGRPLWTAALLALALMLVARARPRPRLLLGAALIGLLVPLGWVGTGLVLYDEFEPIAMESLSFTAPMAETLFYTVASSAVSAGFGVALVAGVILGALLVALARRDFRWQSFDSPRQTGRYMAGAVLMGIGGVLAGGCTLGAGLSGVPTLSLAALLALASIAAGALGLNAVLSPASGESAGSPPRPQAQPAE